MRRLLRYGFGTLTKCTATSLPNWQLNCCQSSSGLIPRWDGKVVSIGLAHTNIPSAAVAISTCILLIILPASSDDWREWVARAFYVVVEAPKPTLARHSCFGTRFLFLYPKIVFYIRTTRGGTFTYYVDRISVGHEV